MLIHLIRHAHALDEEENPARPLSPRGRGEIARLARFFALNARFAPAQLWHSPLLRSRETADELVRRLALDTVQVETPGLLPEDEPEALAERLLQHPRDRGDLAIVGHEPQLGRLAALLVRGKDHDNAFAFKKGAALALELTDEVFKKTGLPRCRVRWFVPPELLPATTIPLAAAATPAPSPPSPSPAP